VAAFNSDSELKLRVEVPAAPHATDNPRQARPDDNEGLYLITLAFLMQYPNLLGEISPQQASFF
jgi:hypothetical protein